MSDVPVGAFLSGGIDSSAVVASMSRLTARPVKTFSVGFSEADFDELEPARRVASLCGTEHHELVLEPDVVPLVEDLAWYLDEPFGDTSAIPTYMVSKLAAEHVKVVLTGDGGDELFAGYDKYVVEERERAYDLMPATLRRAAGMVGAAMPEGMRGRRFLRHSPWTGRGGTSTRSPSCIPTRWARSSRRRPPPAWRRTTRGARRRRTSAPARTGCRPCSTAICRPICRSTC